MKKIFSKLLVLLVAVASGMALTGCGKDNPQNNEPENAQDLIGKWKLVSQVAETKIGDVLTQKETPMGMILMPITSAPMWELARYSITKTERAWTCTASTSTQDVTGQSSMRYSIITWTA